MNPYKVVDQLKKYEKVKKIIVYTNALIIPKGANLDCLKHKKVVVDITNYGEGLSTKHDEIIKILKENEILYSTTLTTDGQLQEEFFLINKRLDE